MKAALVFLCLALLVGVSFAASICNPDGDGKPDCVGRAGLVSRDYWDPTHYWVCDSSGNAVLAACQQQGFDPKTGECVDWSLWQWYAPCP
ncbi:uncharacterized protein LOC111064689 [Drosophila obscura]|uniref:uncharacterized protein LOC111064689 n=1 Tax=Drosophila obscura TaxID=7282 RepID=UPI000BA12BEF|nr:uncharacterized protein LOC111064689 [Drosophila obscura]